MGAPLFLEFTFGFSIICVAVLVTLLDRLLNHGLGAQLGSNVYSTAGGIINWINAGVYKNLDLAPSSSEIRLVHILPGYGRVRCKLVHGNWRTSSYEALSYSWGTAVLVTQIELNGRVFLIGRNLHTALESLRLAHRERAVWIDALSINQKDNIERDHQVQQMRQIYENATSVVVSLGDGTPNTTLGFDYLNNNPDGGPGYLLDARSARDEVRSLLSHSWWKRVWVIQEIAVAKKIQVCRGSCAVPWDVFCRFVTREQPRPQGDEVYARALYKFVERGLPTLRSHPILEYGLLDLAHEFRAREATNPRDKLYALLGLMSNAEQRGLVPDYSKPVREVYMDFARSHITQYQKLPILGFAEYRNNRRLQLPSWCPDWTVQQLTPPPLWQKSRRDLNMWLHETQTFYNASGNSRAEIVHHSDPEVLGLRGLAFDSISAICDYPAVDADTLGWEPFSASNFVVECRDLALGPWPEHIARRSPYGEVMHRKDAFYHTITANVFGRRDVDWEFMEHVFDGYENFPERNEVWTQVSKAVDLACSNRRFFVTSKGFIGLGPAEVRKGDVVCVLLGGNIPFIMRQAGVYHRMVGQSYVHGIMAYSDEEMEDDVRMRKVEYQDFFIR